MASCITERTTAGSRMQARSSFTYPGGMKGRVCLGNHSGGRTVRSETLYTTVLSAIAQTPLLLFVVQLVIQRNPLQIEIMGFGLIRYSNSSPALRVRDMDRHQDPG